MNDHPSSNTINFPPPSEPSVDIIRQTRKLVSGLDDQQRFHIAKKHLDDALQFKTPRLDTYSTNLSKKFKVCYNIQTSTLWSYFLILLSYLYMYVIAVIENE